MKCGKCGSDRMLGVSTKHSDMLDLYYKGKEHHGYGVDGINISEGGSDYLKFDICLNCGTVAGIWPVEDTFVENFE